MVEAETSSGSSQVISVGHRYVDHPLPGDCRIDGGTAFGNHFVLRDQEDDDDRRRVCEAYSTVLADPLSADVFAIAGDFSPPLRVDPRFATLAARTSLLRGLQTLRQRVQAGESLRLMCTCVFPNRQRLCHGHILASFLRDGLVAIPSG